MTPKEATQELCTAVTIGNSIDAEAALAQGADPNAMNGQSVPLLHLAAELSNTIVGVEIGEMLIKAGADVNVRNRRSGETALHRAAYQSDTHFGQMLIENGADLAAKNTFHVTPRIKASMKGNSPFVAILDQAIESQPGHTHRIASSRSSDGKPKLGS